jgi:peptidoglycan/xylan/chitin deacetylase (PgdA/CDA1 family)
MSVLSFATRQAASRFLPSRWYLQRAAPAESRTMPETASRAVSVCLTFDDGPHPSHTPAVLDQLAALSARATFFLIGGNAVQYPTLVRRILADGHSIGSHTHCHSRATRMPAAEYIADAVRAQHAIEDITGVACPLFRPPYGELTPMTLLRILQQQLHIVHWTHEPRDSETSRAGPLVEWFQQHPPFPGAVVLLHDDRPVTARHLGELIHSWVDGVQFCALRADGVCQ